MQVVVCGILEGGSETLYRLIADSVDRKLVALHEVPALDLQAEGDGPSVTHHAHDLVALGKIRKRLAEVRELRVLIVIRDIRDLLVLQPPWLQGDFLHGHDHAFHRGENGVVTYSDPGLVFIGEILKTVLRKGHAHIVRFEDLQADPDRVQRRIAKATGLSFVRPFSESPGVPDRLAALPRWTRLEFAARLLRQFRLAPALFEMLALHGYDANRDWYAALAPAAPEAFDDSPGTIVAFFTTDAAVGRRYEAEAARLLASLRLLNLPVECLAVPSQGDWLANVRHKPTVLLEQRRRLRGPLFYVDVDAVVHSDPWPHLRGYSGDVAVASHHGDNLFSGSLLLNDTPGALRILQLWLDEQALKPLDWDQHSLHSVVQRNRETPFDPPIVVQHLPLEMNRVFDRHYHPRVGNIVEHLQASREMRVADGTERSRLALDRRHARIDEIEAEMLAQADFASQSAADRQRRTEALMAQGRSDRLRWAAIDNLHGNWSLRAGVVARLLAGVLPESGGTVLDLGCGRMDLEAALAPGTVYLPSDLVARDARTLVCDLNAGEMPAVAADVVVLLGVLEYIHDPARLLAAAAARWPRLVLSYNPADRDRGRPRRSHGWVNDLSSAELVELADAVGLDLNMQIAFDPKQTIYEFLRRDSARVHP